MHIALCDDNETELRHLETLLDAYIRQQPDYNITFTSFPSSEQLADAVLNGIEYDMFMLDIIMPQMSGMDIARLIRNRKQDCIIIFLSNSKDYALEAFSVYAAQYLLKPIELEKLYLMLDTLIKRFRFQLSLNFSLDTPEGLIRIPYNRIIMLEIVDHIVLVSQAGGQLFKSKNIRQSFAEYIAPLLEDERFIRPHRSYLINMSYVNRISPRILEMENGTVISVPQGKRKEIREQYMAFLSARKG